MRYNIPMNLERKAKLDKALEQILQTLIAQYQPEKIILYGSLATGDVHEWSDLDLVIIKDTPLLFFQRLKEVALLCYTGVGVDFLVYTPAEFEQMIATGNYFIRDEVIGKGRVLYERQPTPAVA
jgi:predicted nucleotidyltransferase